jgi:hypothetical protein
MTSAEPARLLALFGRWGKNAPVRNFPGLKFMAEMNHVLADQQAIDLFAALQDRRMDEMPADGAGA